VRGASPPGRARSFPSHGQSTEKVHLRAYEVDPTNVLEPSGDGSVNEADAGTIAIEAGCIISMCCAGLIEDPKLEIGVTRLLRLLSLRKGRRAWSNVRIRTIDPHE
jgi:hypothetical protein